MYLITQAILDYFQTKHVELFIDEEPAEVDSEIAIGSELKLVLATGFEFLNNNYMIVGVDPIMTWVEVEEHFTVVGNEATLTVPNEFEMTTSDGNIFTVNVSALEGFVEITEADLTYVSNNNSELFVDGVAAVQGQLIGEGSQLELTIDESNLLKFTNVEILIEYDQTDPFGDPRYLEFNLSENGLSATLTIPEPFDIGSWSETIFQISTEVVEPEVLGSNRVYKVDSEIMQQVTEQRFSQFGDDNLDYGQFILGYIELPSEVPSELVAGSTAIVLGNRTLNVNAPEIVTDEIVFDMGTISVPEDYGNLKDFLNVVFNLHLPYASPIVIEPSYIVGETISIEYRVDLYSGEATINLSSTKTDGKVFNTSRASMAVDVPYITNVSTNLTADNLGVQKLGFNGILKPYLEVIRNEHYLSEGLFTIPIVDEDLLSSNTGFIQVENVKLDFQAIKAEKEEVENILKSGVIINE